VNVVAVIVCYEPDLARLRQTCEALFRSGAAVVLVDNSAPSAVGGPDFADCTVVANGENVGIAQAQNIGIRRAIGDGADVVALFDQDSTIAAGFLEALVRPLRPGTPGVTAPVSCDAAKGFEYPSFRIGRLGLPAKVFRNGAVDPYPVDIVMASGTAVTVETFDRVGMMDEDLFIDSVDTEWSLRCRRRNVPIHVVPTAVMKHSVGSRSVDLRFATVLVHSPVRCYYQIRNCFRLFSKESVPLLFAIRETLTVAAHKALLLLAVPNRSAYLEAFARGFYDGVRGVTGRKGPGRGSLPSR
jgi:rhamnosyltransferase